MIKLKDLITEAKVHRLQIFTPGTGGKEHGNFKFDPSKIPVGDKGGKLKVVFAMSCVNKPKGAFWTSGYRESIQATDWSELKRKKYPQWRTGMGAVFEVVGNPKLAVVRNNDDYTKLLKKYAMGHLEDICGVAGKYILNWGKVANDYDGFRITFKGSRDYIPGVHDWETESTAWFNMSKLKFLGTTKV